MKLVSTPNFDDSRNWIELSINADILPDLDVHRQIMHFVYTMSIITARVFVCCRADPPETTPLSSTSRMLLLCIRLDFSGKLSISTSDREVKVPLPSSCLVLHYRRISRPIQDSWHSRKTYTSPSLTLQECMDYIRAWSSPSIPHQSSFIHSISH